MRKISSHYCLLPDGSLGKRPIITMDDAGKICDVRLFDDDFQEEPGTEYLGGVIIPAFVEDVRCWLGSLSDQDWIDTYLRNAFRQGSLRMIIDEHGCERVQKYRGKLSIKKCVPDHHQIDKYRQCSWERIKSMSDADAGCDVTMHIDRYFKDLIANKSLPANWGRIAIGASPGLLLIQGLDLKKRQLTPKVKLKILVY